MRVHCPMCLPYTYPSARCHTLRSPLCPWHLPCTHTISLMSQPLRCCRHQYSAAILSNACVIASFDEIISTLMPPVNLSVAVQGLAHWYHTLTIC